MADKEYYVDRIRDELLAKCKELHKEIREDIKQKINEVYDDVIDHCANTKVMGDKWIELYNAYNAIKGKDYEDK